MPTSIPLSSPCRLILAVMSLLLCCAMAGMAAETEAATEPLQLTGVPQQLRLTTSVNFDDNGVARTPQVDNQLRFTIPLDHIDNIAGYEDVTIDSVAFDKGASLSGPDLSRHFTRQTMFAGRSHHGRPRAQLFVSLNDVPQEATQITAVSGRMQVLVSTGEPLVADFSPLSEWLDKRVAVDGVPGAVITIQAIGDNEVTMVYSSDITARIMDIEVRDANGTQINSGGSSSRGDGRMTTRTLRLQRPLTAEGSVRFRFHGPTENRPATFTVTDIPLTAAATPPQVEAVITAKPEQPATEPAQEAVELRVLDPAAGVDDF